MSEELEVATLSQIYIYPLKSCIGILVDRAIITKHGLVHAMDERIVDRGWMIIKRNGSYVDQKQLPKMALIETYIDGDYFVVTAPGMERLMVPIGHESNRIPCKGVDLEYVGFSYGGEVSKWLSEFLGKEGLDLVRLDIKPEDARSHQEDGCFMLLSEKSLDELNSRLVKKVSVVNFRPNFVVKNSGNSKAFDEDDWQSLTISTSRFEKTAACIRCIMTTIDPLNGIKDPDMQPLRTLKKYRLKPELYGNSPMFGIYLESKNDFGGLSSFVVSVGDTITCSKKTI